MANEIPLLIAVDGFQIKVIAPPADIHESEALFAVLRLDLAMKGRLECKLAAVSPSEEVVASGILALKGGAI